MDEDSAAFFEETQQLRPRHLEEARQQLADFVVMHAAEGRRVALVTSGGTTVPLEVNTVRFIDNFSTGTRGARCTEAFLKLGYAVVLLHRTGSCFPFLASLQSQLRSKPYALLEKLSSAGTSEACSASALGDCRPPEPLHLLPLAFTTIFDYLFLLREASQALSGAGCAGLCFLAAAVSDFYLPESEMATDKIQSRSHDGLLIQLRNVPKLLGALHSWAPDAYIVSFKLETNRNILDAKAAGALQKYGVNAVCANTLQEARDWVAIVRHDPGTPGIEVAAQEITGSESEAVTVTGLLSERVEVPTPGSERSLAGEGLEAALASRIAELHQEHIEGQGFAA